MLNKKCDHYPACFIFPTHYLGSYFVPKLDRNRAGFPVKTDIVVKKAGHLGVTRVLLLELGKDACGTTSRAFEAPVNGDEGTRETCGSRRGRCRRG